MRARGAMPEAWPMLTPLRMTVTFSLPAAVEAVWSPWPPRPVAPPRSSRGELKAVQSSTAPLASRLLS